MVCPQCQNRWFVPTELAVGPSQQQVARAAKKAKHATRTSRKRKRFEVGLMADQSARAIQARRCPRCGAGGVPPAASSTAPGWYADPYGQAPLRWWDGAAWSEHVRRDHP